MLPADTPASQDPSRGRLTCVITLICGRLHILTGPISTSSATAAAVSASLS